MVLLLLVLCNLWQRGMHIFEWQWYGFFPSPFCVVTLFIQLIAFWTLSTQCSLVTFRVIEERVPLFAQSKKSTFYFSSWKSIKCVFRIWKVHFTFLVVRLQQRMYNDNGELLTWPVFKNAQIKEFISCTSQNTQWFSIIKTRSFLMIVLKRESAECCARLQKSLYVVRNKMKLGQSICPYIKEGTSIISRFHNLLFFFLDIGCIKIHL